MWVLGSSKICTAKECGYHYSYLFAGNNPRCVPLMILHLLPVATRDCGTGTTLRSKPSCSEMRCRLELPHRNIAVSNSHGTPLMIVPHVWIWQMNCYCLVVKDCQPASWVRLAYNCPPSFTSYSKVSPPDIDACVTYSIVTALGLHNSASPMTPCSAFRAFPLLIAFSKSRRPRS